MHTKKITWMWAEIIGWTHVFKRVFFKLKNWNTQDYYYYTTALTTAKLYIFEEKIGQKKEFLEF